MIIGELLGLLAGLSGILFVITSMLAMGLSLTVPMITQPLRNVRLVLLTLLANFVLVPLLAYLVLLIIPLEEPLEIGLIILACAAGAPFLPKLVQGANGDIALGVGLMVLLMVVTIFYMPLVLPFLLSGVEVNPWDIAQSLIVLMLVPLAIGLLIKSHAPDSADHWQPVMNKVSSVALLFLLVVALGLNLSNIIGFIGTRGILALLLFIVGGLVIGLIFGGRDPAVRNVMTLATPMRNISAAIVVTAQNFSGTDTLPFVLVGGILLLLVLLPAGRILGSRAAATTG
ncbi:MAG: bile acid:sodium symporter [Anaerolineae bacterium]|nr:bile acid:sodium symporter [Anaerolineae bacterium]